MEIVEDGNVTDCPAEGYWGSQTTEAEDLSKLDFPWEPPEQLGRVKQGLHPEKDFQLVWCLAGDTWSCDSGGRRPLLDLTI